MPIYEYACQDCKTEFELIRRFQDADAGLNCTSCDSENIKRRISLFNASSGGRSITSSNSCGGCAGGACSTCACGAS